MVATNNVPIGIQRITTRYARTRIEMPFSDFLNPQAFRAHLPKASGMRLPFLLSALEVWKASSPSSSIEENNHILAELRAIFARPASSMLVNRAIDYALHMATIDSNDKWAGITALTAIPIPAGHPKLPEIVKLLLDTLKTEAHWPNTEAATHALLSLRDTLPAEYKGTIRFVAEHALPHYQEAAKRNTWDSVRNLPAVIVAKLDEIITAFADA